jgi:hypothetical protein
MFIDQNGGRQQLPLDVVMYRAAADAGLALPQYLNREFKTDASKNGTVFDQVCASEGISIQGNREIGIRPSTMYEMVHGTGVSIDAAVNTKEAVPASRILFPAVFLQAVEDRLQSSLSMTKNAFESLIASDESISGDRYEQPQINYDKPTVARSQGIAQLAAPASMVTITTSDKAFRIPNFSLGLEVSDQALKASSLDFVAMSVARQAAVQGNERAQGYMLALLNGDVDNADGSLASKGKVTAGSALDSASNAVLTQKAWIKYMVLNSQKRTITHIVTDIDGALAIENRTGRPTNQTDNANSPRINTQFQVANPLWPDVVNLFITVDPSWPAGTIMGFDKNWAIRRVRNLNAEYEAIEAYVMRRSTMMRFDFGEHVNRLFDDAFDVLTLN